MLDAGPVLGPGHRLGQRRTRGPHACTGPSPARSAAPTRCRWDPTTPAAASAGRWCTTPATRRGFTRPTSTPSAPTASAPTGRSSYTDLRPYYEQIEAELPVAGQDWPWGDPHRYPHSPHPVGGNGEIFLRGARGTGHPRRASGPVAIPNGRFGNRPHCIYRGFCLQGCKVNAKASPLITHIPDALAHGAEIRADCMVSRVARR